MESENEWVCPLNFWIDLLRDGILLAEINEDQARSFFLHLADLGVFELVRIFFIHMHQPIGVVH